LGKRKRHAVTDFKGLHLDRDDRNDSVEQVDHVEESTGDVLRYEHSTMVILRISLSFKIPVFYGSNDVAFIRTSKLKLDLIPFSVLRIFQEKIQPASFGLI